MTAPSSEIVREVRAKYGPRTLLAFSCGKDSIAAYLAIRDSFDEVVPYYCYLVPDLEFVEESIAHYERAFGCKIWRMPHPSLYRWLRTGLYQTPARAAVICAADLPEFEYRHVVQILGEHLGIKTPMAADGIRAADSPLRRIGFQLHGAIRPADLRYCPVWDWNLAKVVSEIRKSGIGLPIDYEVFGRTFDGLDYRFVIPIKTHFPRDYARIVEMFPLIEGDVWRYERAAA